MHNGDIPTGAELPTTKQLLRSSLIAVVAAIAILIAIVLPAEYAIDPTGIGHALGLAEMGEIKARLAVEAEQDRVTGHGKKAPLPVTTPDKGASLLGRIFAELVIGPAAAQAAGRTDDVTITLKPGEDIEIKMTMKQGARVNFSWKVTGGEVAFDMHGHDGSGQSATYAKGRSAPGAEGVLEAAFDGEHGWYWRNRTTKDVTLTLHTSGDYAGIKRIL